MEEGYRLQDPVTVVVYQRVSKDALWQNKNTYQAIHKPLFAQ